MVIDSETKNICGLHQPGTEPLTQSTLNSCVSQAQKKTKAVAEVINMAVKNAEPIKMEVSEP